MPPVGGVLVGRERELGEVRAAVADVVAGRGSLLLVAGEAGIGKTRLADAFVAVAAEHGVAVHWGRAWEVGGAPAYWPWIEVLRSVSATAAVDTADLDELVPELALRGARERPLLEPAQARFRLFAAVARFLGEAARIAPVAIVLDDLHAADLPSLSLLHFVCRGLRAMPVVIVGTYRDVEARLDPALADLMAKLTREGKQLALRRLDRDEVASWALEVADADADLAGRLYETTEGNPLFMVETLRLVQAVPGRAVVGRLAAGVAAVIEARLATLPPEARGLLEIASVLGRSFDLGLVAELGAIPATRVRAKLRAAFEADVVVAASADRAAFTHILLREALHGALHPSRRAELHHAVARILEVRLGGDETAPLEELVHHLVEAQPLAGPASLITWARRAAERATQRLAFEDAAAHLALVVELVPADDHAERCDATLARASADTKAGRLAAGREHARRAADLARRMGDFERLGRAALAYGEVIGFAMVDPALVASLEEALAGVAAESPLRARLLARLVSALQPARDPAEPMRIARRAIELARAGASLPDRLAVVHAAGSALLYFAHPRERIAVSTEVVELAARLGDKLRAVRARLRLVFDHLEIGDVQSADACIAEHARLAAEIAHPAVMWHVPLVRGTRAVMQGRFAAAADLVAEAREIARQTEDPSADLCLDLFRIGFLSARARRDELAVEAPDALGRIQRANIDGWYGGACAAATWARLGRLDQVRAEIERLRGELEAFRGRLSAAWLAEAALAVHDREVAEAMHDALVPLADRNHCWGVLAMVCEAPLTHPLARLAAALGRHDDAERHFADAERRCEAMGAVPARLRVELDWARALRERGRAADAERARALYERVATSAAALDLDDIVDAATRERAEIGNAPRSQSRAELELPPGAPFSLRLEGDYWTIESEGAAFRLRDSRGLRILDQLVRHPEQEFHATDLLAPAGGAGLVEDAGEMLDRDAVAQYRARLRAIDEELAEAEAWNDAGRAERLRDEKEMVAAELARGVGLGGRSRKAADSSERARSNVQRRVRDAIRKIGEHDERLGRHLDWAVRTGNFCGYHPSGRR